jgi:hypothetical protein
VAGLAPEARVELRYTNIVMAGHQRERVLAQMTRPSTTSSFTKQDVDARHKAGHDEEEMKAGSDPGLFSVILPSSSAKADDPVRRAVSI